ncbi:hypothetical protein Lalb_Chr17g0342581 [Lupinus albus]|uniref:Uncharacterized protein n=1 Tax=Lupinus albus TaxID=3870 RepID=A0A6A4P2Z9_LUPAL|nr:hypothetical protein Lalb_Chr17g0342581 [Lupinus albus]
MSRLMCLDRPVVDDQPPCLNRSRRALGCWPSETKTRPRQDVLVRDCRGWLSSTPESPSPPPLQAEADALIALTE